MSKAVKQVRALTIKELAEKIERENKEFNKMTKAQKRVKIAEDCLDRIYMSQIKPESGSLIGEGSIKGGLFLSYIGRVNSKNFDELTHDHEIDGPQMVTLTKIFSVRQLELMEVFFEGVGYSFYDNRDLCPKISTSIEFPQSLLKRVGSLVGIRQGKSGKIKGDTEKMIYICENLIENKGTFKI